MEALDTGTRGAKVQSWKRANPRDLLKRVITENKHADKHALLKVFRDELRSHADTDDLVDSIVEYWFANNYYSLTGDRTPTEPRQASAQKVAAVEAIKEKVKERIRHEAMLLLDTVLPNGKALKDTTFGECTKIGGALKLIASKGKPSQVVGKVLSDAQLRKLQGGT